MDFGCRVDVIQAWIVCAWYRLRAWHLIVLLMKCRPPAAALKNQSSEQQHLLWQSKFMGLLAGIAVLGGAATLFAQGGTNQPKVGEGTLMVQW